MSVSAPGCGDIKRKNFRTLFTKTSLTITGLRRKNKAAKKIFWEHQTHAPAQQGIEGASIVGAEDVARRCHEPARPDQAREFAEETEPRTPTEIAHAK